MNAMQKDVGPSKKPISGQNKSKKVKHESIWRAASNGNLERVKRWLQKDTTLLHAKDEYGKPPLHWAVSKNHCDVIQYLLDQGADCDSKDTHGKTALHWVNQLKIAQLLVQSGANLNVQDQLGKAPVHWIDDAKIVALLIQKSANPNVQDNEGKTPLHWAAGTGNASVVRVLVTNRANINALCRQGKTPLHCAILSGHLATINLLLSQRTIDVNAQDLKKGRTALQWALRMCKGALEKTQKLHSVSNTGMIIISLIKNGANAELCDKKHKSPAQRISFMRCTDHEKNLLHMAVQYNSLTNSHQKKLLDHLKMLE